MENDEFWEKCAEAEDIRDKCRALYPNRRTARDAVTQAYLDDKISWAEYTFALDENYGGHQ